MKKALLLFAALLLAACTTTERANEVMSARFVGTPVDSFFLRYGPPTASHALNDGRRMYLWAENAQHVTFTGVSTAQVTMVGSTGWVTGWNTPRSTVNIQCQVRLLVDQRGRIQKILSHSDSIGWWQLSRCHELFGR